MTLLLVKASLSQEMLIDPEVVRLLVDVTVGCSERLSYTTMVRRDEFMSNFDIIWKAVGSEIRKNHT